MKEKEMLEIIRLNEEISKLKNRIKELEDKLVESEEQLKERDEKIKELTQIVKVLEAKLKQLMQPPLYLAWVLKVISSSEVLVVMPNGQIALLRALPELRIKPGEVVLLNDAGMLVKKIEAKVGPIVVVQEILNNQQAVIEDGYGRKKILFVPQHLVLKPGQAVRTDPYLNIVLEIVNVKEREIQELEIKEIPKETFKDVGGLNKEIDLIKKILIYPIVYKELFQEFNLPPVRGALFYGPPGCGKTLLAKALVNEMAKILSEKFHKEIEGYFLYVKGPELSSKYVGETERMLREIFRKAKEKAEEGFPVLIFFDELESFLLVRGAGISSDVNLQYVSQFNSLMDGLTERGYVIVIGATNRPDLVDPAVIREGRLNPLIEIPRPKTKEQIKEIFRIYLKKIPLKEDIEDVLERISNYLIQKNEKTSIIKVEYRYETETLYFIDFISGARIKAIVERAARKAIERKINNEGEPVVTLIDLFESLYEVFDESKHLFLNPHALKQEFLLRNEDVVKIINLLGEKEVEKDRVVEGKDSGLT
jgi:proteasome-associated ATPase